MQKQLLYFSWFSESVCLIISARIVFRFVRRPAATSPIRSEDTFFFRDYKSGLPSVLPHLARSETAHTPGSSHRQYRRSLCKPPRTEYASLSLSHIFRIHLRTAWLSFSLGKGSAREIPFFLWKNNKEEQAARTFWRSLNHAEPWLSIGCEIFVDKLSTFSVDLSLFSVDYQVIVLST